MSDPDPRDPLTDRLQAAAADLSPTFSPALHAEVLRRVDRARVAARPLGWQLLAVRWSAVAAVVALVVGLAALRWVPRDLRPPGPTGGPPPTVAIAVPALPSVSAAVGSMSDAVSRGVAGVRHDYVDGGAAQLSRYCRAGWDLLPTPSPAVVDHPACTSPSSPESGRG